MGCQDNYITLNRNDGVSRSGLYGSDLPGVEELFVSLTSKPGETDDESWERVYRNAWTNMVSDVEAFLQQKFFVNSKLVSRQTSEIKQSVNANSGLAGISIQFSLPRYASIHILSAKLFSEQDYLSPAPVISIYEEDETGDLLSESSQSVSEGKNEFFIDQDFEANKLFIAYDASSFQFRTTENKFFNTGYPVWNKFECVFPCFGGEASVKQINGGGLNVIFDVFCSAEKFVCENLNLFKKVFWWKIGEEMAVERRIGNRLNEATTMTDERKTELATFYSTQYNQALNNALKAQNLYEDPYCFQCKGSISTKVNLP